MYKLGLKPPRPDSIAMKFGSYFKAADLPAVPKVFGRPWLIRNWGMLGNDHYGDCYWAGAAHETAMLCADADIKVPTFTTNNVLSDYRDCTGSSADEGTDMQQGAAYRQKTGIVDILGKRHTIDIYTALRPGDLKELDLAVFLLGIAGVGVQLPNSTQYQFNNAEPFSVVRGADVIGGHYIPVIGRNSMGDYLAVTWGRLTAITPGWIAEYMDQGTAILSRERLSQKGLSPQGYNLSQLTDDYHNLMGA